MSDENTSHIDTNVDNGMQHEVVVEQKPLSWFAMRDLTRANAKRPSYKVLAEKGFEVFTPMKWKVTVRGGKRRRFEAPVLLDLLFVHSDYESIKSAVESSSTLQFRYARGAYCKPIIIRDSEMEHFIRAATNAPDPRFLAPEEITKLSIGRDIKIIGGPLQGVEGKIINVRGLKKKRILVSIPDFISAVVEVEPVYLEFIDNIQS